MVGIRDTSATDVTLDSGPRRRRRLLIAGGVIGLLVIGAAMSLPAVSRWSDAERSVALERLRLATVQRGEFVRDISAQGRVVAAVSPTLYASEEGTVTLLVQAGETVALGQPLARIDSPALSNQLEQARSQLATLEVEVSRQRIRTRQQQLENQQRADLAEVRIRAAERELRRAEESFRHQVISQQDYEKAQDDLATAKLEHEHAIEDARLAQEVLAFEQQTRELELERQRLAVAELERRAQALTVTSPVAGIVGNLAVEQKDAVADNQPLMTVVDLTAFEVEIPVPESYADDLGLGMATEITVGGQRYPGRLTAVSPEVRASQVTTRMRFEGDELPPLRQNQRVTARIVIDQRPDVVMVQRGPFFDSGAGRVIYVVEDGVARRREITTGAVSLSAIEVLSGLQPGERVIISDVETFRGAETALLTD